MSSGRPAARPFPNEAEQWSNLSPAAGVVQEARVHACVEPDAVAPLLSSMGAFNFAQKAGCVTVDNNDPVPLEELSVGGVANGVVIKVLPWGATVDVGAVKAGMLLLPRDLRSEIQRGDYVQGMIVKSIDVNRRRFCLIMEAPLLEEIADVF